MHNKAKGGVVKKRAWRPDLGVIERFHDAGKSLNFCFVVPALIEAIATSIVIDEGHEGLFSRLPVGEKAQNSTIRPFGVNVITSALGAKLPNHLRILASVLTRFRAHAPTYER